MDRNGTDLIEMQENKQTKEKQTNLRSKYICIVVVVIIIIIIWTIVFCPSVVTLVVITRGNISRNSQGIYEARINSLPDELPPININNITNYSIISIACENKFVYEPKGSICYPPCAWDPTETNLTLLTQILFLSISAIGLVMSVATLIVWLVASYLECRKNNSCEFQLARASLFMIVLSTLGIFVTNTAIDILGRERLLCDRNKEGQLYLLAHMFEQATDPGDRRTLTNVIGALSYFFFLSTFYWIVTAFKNILLVIFLPLRVNDMTRERVVFSVQVVGGLVFPLIMITIVCIFNPQTPFAGNYQAQQVYVSGPIVFLTLFVLILSINAGLVITLAIIALTKLRLVSLRVRSLTGRRTELTDLERRLLLYSFLYSITFALLSVNLSVFAILESRYLDLITEHIICVNVNSAIAVQLYNSNSTLLAYRENTVGNLTICKAILDRAISTLPVWVTIIVSVIMRLAWLIVFVILIPNCTPKCIHKSIVKKVHKLTTNQNSVVRNKTH